MDGRKAIKITDIANMIYLADGVLFAAYAAFMFDENGIRLQGEAAINEQIEKDKANGIDNDLIMSIIHSVHDITDAVETTPEKILEKLSPIRNRILGMTRNGGIPTDSFELDELCADPSVPDEWLLELFAMRVRDRMIACALHKDKEKIDKSEEDK